MSIDWAVCIDGVGGGGLGVLVEGGDDVDVGPGRGRRQRIPNHRLPIDDQGHGLPQATPGDLYVVLCPPEVAGGTEARPDTPNAMGHGAVVPGRRAREPGVFGFAVGGGIPAGGVGDEAEVFLVAQVVDQGREVSGRVTTYSRLASSK